MTYNKTIWSDRVVQYPNRYKDQSNVQYTFSRDEGTITNNGTQITAGRMNNIENELAFLDRREYDTSEFSVYKSSKDSQGLYTVITVKRGDGTKVMTSTLSGGSSPTYTTRTEVYYGSDGISIERTKVYTRTYDVDDDLISEVLN